MSSTYVLIQKSILASNASEVVFSSIPQTYTDLYLMMNSRSTRNDAPVDNVVVQFNGNSTNLTQRYMVGNGSSASVASESNLYLSLGGTPSATSASGAYGFSTMYVPGYSRTDAEKTMIIESATGTASSTSYTAYIGGYRANTEAITAIRAYAAPGPNFAAGSSFYLYGIKK